MTDKSTVYCKTAVIGGAVFAGFTVSSYIGSTLSYIAAAVLLSCAAFCVIRKTGSQLPLLLLASLSAAFLAYGIYGSVYVEGAQKLCDTTRTVNATVLSADNTGNDTVRVTASGTADGIPVKFSFFFSDIGFAAGQDFTAEVTFSEPRDTVSYNSVYSYSDGIFVRAALKEIEMTGSGNVSGIPEALASYREYIKDTVKAAVGGDEAGLILAMFFGDKSSLSAEMSEGIRKSGLSHMTAVSGLHISLIIVTLMSLLELAGPGRHRVMRFAAAAALAVTFMLFYNMTASVRRSGIMMIIYYGASLARRRPDVPNSLGAAVLLILMTEPCACRDPGLILSVCGTFGAGILAPAVCEHYRIRGRLKDVMSAVCATYCTIPASALYFGGVSLISPLTTVIVYVFFIAAAVPVLSLMLSGGLVGAMAPVLASYCLKPMVWIIKLAGGLPYGYIRTDSVIMLPFLIISALFILTAVFLAKRRKTGIRLPVIACVTSFCAFVGLAAAGKLAGLTVTEISIFSDGSNYLAAVSNSSGVSLYASGVSKKLSAEAYAVMTGHNTDRFDLVCAVTEEKKRAMYPGTYLSLPALAYRCLEDGEVLYDVGGKYTAHICEDACELEINGISIIMCDISAADVYGAHDIGVYSRYKRSQSYDLNNVTVLCDRRYTSPENAYSAYYGAVTVFINENGEYYVEYGL